MAPQPAARLVQLAVLVEEARVVVCRGIERDEVGQSLDLVHEHGADVARGPRAMAAGVADSEREISGSATPVSSRNKASTRPMATSNSP